MRQDRVLKRFNADFGAKCVIYVYIYGLICPMGRSKKQGDLMRPARLPGRLRLAFLLSFLLAWGVAPGLHMGLCERDAHCEACYSPTPW